MRSKIFSIFFLMSILSCGNFLSGYNRKIINLPTSATYILSNDSNVLVVAGLDGSAFILSSDKKEQISSLTVFSRGQLIDSASFSMTEPKIAFAGASVEAKIYNYITKQYLFSLVGHKSSIDFVTFSPNGARLLTCSH